MAAKILTVSLPDSVIDQLMEYLEKTGKNKSKVVSSWIEEGLKKDGHKTGSRENSKVCTGTIEK